MLDWLHGSTGTSEQGFWQVGRSCCPSLSFFVTHSCNVKYESLAERGIMTTHNSHGLLTGRYQSAKKLQRSSKTWGRDIWGRHPPLHSETFSSFSEFFCVWCFQYNQNNLQLDILRVFENQLVKLIRAGRTCAKAKCPHLHAVIRARVLVPAQKQWIAAQICAGNRVFLNNLFLLWEGETAGKAGGRTRHSFWSLVKSLRRIEIDSEGSGVCEKDSELPAGVDPLPLNPGLECPPPYERPWQGSSTCTASRLLLPWSSSDATIAPYFLHVHNKSNKVRKTLDTNVTPPPLPL